jgi:outer membrane murein-binding lipoprotein Lpp
MAGETKAAELQLENERLRKTVDDLRRELAVAKMSPVRRFSQFVSAMPRKKFNRLLIIAFLLSQTMLAGGILAYRSLKSDDDREGKEDPHIS